MAEQLALTIEPTMHVDEFVTKWRNAALREHANSQTHFNDICAVLGVAAPVVGDPSGESYTFEKHVELPGGAGGRADVWKRGHFGWEYKSGGRSLDHAYQQLLGYREALGNPPILVVCDMNRFEIHTNFTNTTPRVIEFTLKELGENPTHYIKLLRDVFQNPDALHPNNDPRYITETAAAKFGEVAEALRERDSHDASLVARFLNRIIFCFFAESVGLFRNLRGDVETPVTDVFNNLAADATLSQRIVGQLFEAMAERDVRNFGAYYIRWFNGGLFDEAALPETLPLTADLTQIIDETAELNWSRVDPAIFGTLFERGLDPKRRSQLGAHYTDPDNITRVVEPVALRPLRREFEALRAALAQDRAVQDAPAPGYGENGSLAFDAPDPDSPAGRVRAFHDRLAGVRVLDPACGSGNFLYVAMRELKNLEQELIDWAQSLGVNGLRRRIGPQNMLGIDIDPFAADLTRMSLWIGHIQWNIEHGIDTQQDPVLGRADQIECRDAILAEDTEGNPIPAEWPEAEFIIGNPPFLGMRNMRRDLGDGYVERLRHTWADDLDGRVDLCVYWHEMARRAIASSNSARAGLLATQNIRGIFSRPVLARINSTGRIFLAYSDEEWMNDGASVRIAIVCQDNGHETELALDGSPVDHISAMLTADADLSNVDELDENSGIAFQGVILTGDFDVDSEAGERMRAAPLNVNGRPNTDVVHPFASAADLAGRSAGRYVVNFDLDTTEAAAAQYEQPFEYLKAQVKPYRLAHKRAPIRERWWLHEAPRPQMRKAIRSLSRWIATPLTSKHRYFSWMEAPTVPQSTIVVIARSDDYAFGVLHSQIHETWTLATSPRLGVGNDPRYVHTQCFNTFPFPWPLNTPDDALTDRQVAHREAIGEAAASLNNQREAWLNPPNIDPAELRQRTMTNLYNERPTWLDIAHREIDEAVFAAYGWPADLSEDEILARLLALNLERIGEYPTSG